MEEQQVLNKDLLLESKGMINIGLINNVLWSIILDFLVLKEENDEMKNQIYRHYQREAAQTLGLGSLESSLSELVELVRHVQLSTKEIQNVNNHFNLFMLFYLYFYSNMFNNKILLYH